MYSINPDTTSEELAPLISQALDAAGITATLSGGSAVSLYTDNEYQSRDLDFLTAAAHKELREAISPLADHYSNLERDRSLGGLLV